VQVKSVITNGEVKETGRLMRRMVDIYHRDMLPWAHLSLTEIFDLIKNLPFRPDPEDNETLMRPRYTMTMQGTGGDCDDKSIALASWAKLNGVPYKFVAVRKYGRDVFHHVYCLLRLSNGRWITADPTYSFNSLGRERIYEQYAII
jgi:transglutaminase-like putative cysteine protease